MLVLLVLVSIRQSFNLTFQSLKQALLDHHGQNTTLRTIYSIYSVMNFDVLLGSSISLYLRMGPQRDFPSGPVVKILPSHVAGTSSIPG